MTSAVGELLGAAGSGDTKAARPMVTGEKKRRMFASKKEETYGR
jgi:hypothetical protein